MRSTCSFLTLIGLVVLTSSCKAPERTKEWWENAEFFQIYPRSFKDSDGDGLGDLNGITSKLQYLKDIGVKSAWISPIFKSPMFDMGYDVSNYIDIHPGYGTLEDFDNLILEANRLGLKILLDFVPNHSSDEHEWFVKSENRVEGFEDYYIWDDGKIDPSNPAKRLPPSNWLSAFRGSGWTWSDKRNQFYYHAFNVKQPDLNFRNPLVVKEMEKVLTFWLERGVSGFRCDAVTNIYEKAPFGGIYQDEPVNPDQPDPDDFDHLKHIYVMDQPESIEIVYEWRKLLDEYREKNGGDQRILMIETGSPNSYSHRFYGNATVEGAQLPFNFNLIFKVQKNTNAKELVEAVDTWLDGLPFGRTPNWVVSSFRYLRVMERRLKQKI